MSHLEVSLMGGNTIAVSTTSEPNIFDIHLNFTDGRAEAIITVPATARDLYALWESLGETVPIRDRIAGCAHTDPQGPESNHARTNRP